MLRTAAVILLVCGLSALLLAVDSPDRSRGISIHMLPKRVADLGGEKWGLRVSNAEYLRFAAGPPTLQNAKDFLAFVRMQDKLVQENGVWIVITDPDAYSEPEKALLEDVKVL